MLTTKAPGVGGTSTQRFWCRTWRPPIWSCRSTVKKSLSVCFESPRVSSGSDKVDTNAQIHQAPRYSRSHSNILSATPVPRTVIQTASAPVSSLALSTPLLSLFMSTQHNLFLFSVIVKYCLAIVSSCQHSNFFGSRNIMNWRFSQVS